MTTIEQMGMKRPGLDARFRRALHGLVVGLSIGLVSFVANAQATPALSAVSDQDAYEIVRDAYVYAYPMLVMDATRRVATNFVDSSPIGYGPPNRFNHALAFPGADFKAVIRPNVDTLYSSAWLDLGAEPMVLSVPAADRYFMLPLLSLWSDVFAVPGTRTTGALRAQDFLVVGPQWTGAVPSGLKLIRSPTRWVWIIGRTQTNGAADYANVHRLQSQYGLVPLSAWGKADYVPPKGKFDPEIDMKLPPPVQVDRMNAAAFFVRFSQLLKDNPPNLADYPTLHRLERVGFVAGSDFDFEAASPRVKQAFERGTADAKKIIAQAARSQFSASGAGWAYRLTGGAYGVDYLYRAAIAYAALGYNLAQDAVYPSLSTDSEGRQLNGQHRYAIHFAKGQLPPANAFWSLTAYDTQGYFIPNAINRQAIGDRDPLVMNEDGSLDIYMQAEPPGQIKNANWLPVGNAPFNVMLRVYSPRTDILTGAWTPPVLRRTDP